MVEFDCRTELAAEAVEKLEAELKEETDSIVNAHFELPHEHQWINLRICEKCWVTERSVNELGGGHE